MAWNIIAPVNSTCIPTILSDGVGHHIFGMWCPTNTPIRGTESSDDQKTSGRPIITYRCATLYCGSMKGKRNIGDRYSPLAPVCGPNNRRWMSGRDSLLSMQLPLDAIGGQFKTLRMTRSSTLGVLSGSLGSGSRTTTTMANLFGLKPI